MTTWSDQVGPIRQAVDDWQPRLLNPEVPGVGSSLTADDRDCPLLPCSQLAWWSISVGIEHLDATLRLLDAQIADGGPILPSANQTILRAGLIGASQAVVLLAPSRRQDRTTAALQIAHEEFRQLANFRRRTLEHPGAATVPFDTSEDRRRLARIVAHKERVAQVLSQRGAKTRLTDTEVIERAAELVHPEGEDAILLRLGLHMGWAGGSGAAHGRFLMRIHRADIERSEEGAVAMFRGSKEDIEMQIVSVFLVLNQAMRWWDLRRI